MTVRDVTTKLAPLLQQLELEQPRVVTKTELQSAAAEAGLTWPVEVVIRRLRERGWLLDLETRGVWEFAPAARAGAFGSGDPLIELRATLQRDSGAQFTVAAESAAYLLGLTSRRPELEVVGAPEGVRLPRALRKLRVVRWTPSNDVPVKGGLPVWSTATLIAFMATRPSGYRDWPNVGEWIAQAAREVTAETISKELGGRSRAVWARAAYLVGRGGCPEAGARLLALAPPGAGPYHMGDRGVSGRYDKRYDVVDSTGMEVAAE